MVYRMDLMLLTQNSTPIFKYIVMLLGMIMNLIFEFLDLIGIPNIGLSIILFTIVIYFLLMPLTIRHPMYTSTILLFLSIPLVLGSGIAFLLFLAYPVLIAKRIRNEEQVLEEGLAGYREYKQKVKYRLIPFIW